MAEQQLSASADQHASDRNDDDSALHQRDDRWAWRRWLRAHPATHLAYRIAVGIVGVLLIVLAALTGWLPGPGGIPLALIGLAVLASEFEWAQRLLRWAKRKAKRFAAWARKFPSWAQITGTIGIVVAVLAVAWGWLVVIGIPATVPDFMAGWLAALPGVQE